MIFWSCFPLSAVSFQLLVVGYWLLAGIAETRITNNHQPTTEKDAAAIGARAERLQFYYLCPMKDFTLLMLPFGGGNETSYQKFEQCLDKKIKMMNAEAPGKGRRIKEPLLKNMYLIADAYFDQFKPHLKEPYAIFGHSMGAYIGHLIIQRAMDEKLPLPKHFFVTSKIAPSRNYNKKRSIYTNEQFVQHLKDLKGMPDAILENEELLQIFLPIIRNDFDALDLYKYKSKEPYPVDMTMICGTHEDVPDDQLTDWKKETSGEFVFERWEGHHFWIFDHIQALCQRINQTLEKY